MKLNFTLPTLDGECRCLNCGRLLAKVKLVDSFARIEIKCPRGRCGMINTFEIRSLTDKPVSLQ